MITQAVAAAERTNELGDGEGAGDRAIDRVAAQLGHGAEHRAAGRRPPIQVDDRPAEEGPEAGNGYRPFDCSDATSLITRARNWVFSAAWSTWASKVARSPSRMGDQEGMNVRPASTRPWHGAARKDERQGEESRARKRFIGSSGISRSSPRK